MELNFLGRKKFMWKLNSDLKEPFWSHCQFVIRQESYLDWRRKGLKAVMAMMNILFMASACFACGFASFLF